MKKCVLPGAWPHFVIDSHHVRYQDDAVMLGEELSNVANTPNQEETLEGMAEGGGNVGAEAEGPDAAAGADEASTAGEEGATVGAAADVGAAASGDAAGADAEGHEDSQVELDFNQFDDGKGGGIDNCSTEVCRPAKF